MISDERFWKERGKFLFFLANLSYFFTSSPLDDLMRVLTLGKKLYILQKRK